MKRDRWLSGSKRSVNYCEVCGDFAGNIDGICKVCKIKKLSEQPEMLKRMAAQMANPVRQRMDYQGLFRRAVIVEEVEDNG